MSVALSSIRGQMEPPGYPPGTVLIADRYTVRFNPETVTTDVLEFEAALTAGARAVNEEAAEHLSVAARLYGGPLLPGYYEDWIQSERERLSEAHIAALDRLISLRESAGDVRDAIQVAQQGLRRDPLRESLHRSLMQLYVVAGDPAAALRQYRKLERLLADRRQPRAGLAADRVGGLFPFRAAHAGAPLWRSSAKWTAGRAARVFSSGKKALWKHSR